MRYRRLDENGDYSFGHSQSNFYQDEPAAVAQAVQTRLGLWKGEWFIDTSDGMLWSASVLGKYPKPLYDMAIRQRILGTPGVTKIDRYESTFDGNARRLNVTVTIDTAYGSTTVTGTL